MKKILAILVLLSSSALFAQVSLSTTTLSAAVNANPAIQNFVQLASNAAVQVSPSTNVQTVLYVDTELMNVLSVAPITGVLTVQRGYNGTQAAAHNSGATVFVGTPNQFFTYNPTGACVASQTPVTPWINVLNGTQWLCTGGLWTINVNPAGSGSSSSSATVAPNQTAWYVSKNCGSQTNCTTVKADGRYVIDATSNSTTTVTCPNNDCNFTQADVGKTVWATTQGPALGNVGYLVFTTYVCPVTTIASVNSAQSITLNVACTASGTANVVLYWATDDGAALASLDATVGCSTVYLPDPGFVGNYILDSQPFLVNPPSASQCNQAFTAAVGNPAPALTGTGWGSPQSTIMIHPNFNWTACKAITGASGNVCIGGTARSIANLVIYGSGLTAASNASCGGAANKIMLSGSPTATIIYGVDMAGICPGASGMRGIEVNATDEIFAEGGVQDVGAFACAVHGKSSIQFQANDCHDFDVSGGTGLIVDASSQMTDLGSDPIQTASINGTFIGRGTHFVAGGGTTTALFVNNGGISQHFGDFIGVDSIGLATATGVNIASGGKSYFTATKISASGTSITNAGTVISMGGNTLGALAAGTGKWLGTGVLSGSCSGTATSSSILGLFQLGQYTTPNCTSTTVNAGVGLQVLPLSGSIFELSVNAGTGCLAANTCVFTVMKTHNGSTAATNLTCSLTGGASSCQDTTHFDIGVAGDSYSVQFTTGAAETLANVTATVVAW